MGGVPQKSGNYETPHKRQMGAEIIAEGLFVQAEKDGHSQKLVWVPIHTRSAQPRPLRYFIYYLHCSYFSILGVHNSGRLYSRW